MRRFAVAALFAILLAIGVPAIALVNPHFTPIDLVKQSALVAVIKPSAPDAKGRLTAQVVRCLKGKAVTWLGDFDCDGRVAGADHRLRRARGNRPEIAPMAWREAGREDSHPH